MSYKVKEIFYSLQGEGAQTGRAAIFCRFSGCNLWTGKEEDRKTAICSFCDTDFIGTNGDHGSLFQSPKELVDEIQSIWFYYDQKSQVNPLVVLTGGEPGLQVDKRLIEWLHCKGFDIAIETNGTLELPLGIDWICVSPKGRTHLKINKGNELKIVYPQENINPKEYEDLKFDHFFLQPMDGPEYEKSLKLSIDYCLSNPKWRLSLQMHKFIGIR